MTHRLLLDTSSLTYRAYFALPTSITDAQKRPVNAVRGYLDMTARLVTDRRPDEVLHVFDHDWRPAPRVAAWAGYKAERPEEPEDLSQQFTLLRDVLEAFGQTLVEAPGWEADDAIGVLAARCQPSDRVEVVTGDRDLLQLVRDPCVRVLFTIRGVSELAEFDEAAVRQRYGVAASRYTDFAILRGDPSDGLPGVKGVGEKTARDLVGRYESLPALLADADAQTPRLAQQLRDAAGYLEAMRAVVPVRCDVDLTISATPPDVGALERLADERRIDGPIARLREALGV